MKKIILFLLFTPLSMWGQSFPQLPQVGIKVGINEPPPVANQFSSDTIILNGETFVKVKSVASNQVAGLEIIKAFDDKDAAKKGVKIGSMYQNTNPMSGVYKHIVLRYN